MSSGKFKFCGVNRGKIKFDFVDRKNLDSRAIYDTIKIVKNLVEISNFK